MYLRMVFAGAALTVMAGCGGATTGLLTPNDLQQELDSYTRDFGDAITDRDYSDISGLSTGGGSATYNGLIGIGPFRGVNADFTIVDSNFASPLTMRIAFATNVVTGTATEFIRVSDGTPLEGKIAINASLLRSVNPNASFPIVGELTGRIEIASGLTANLDGDFVADLFGDRIDALNGDSDGDLVTRDLDNEIVETESYHYDADIFARRTN